MQYEKCIFSFGKEKIHMGSFAEIDGHLLKSA